ncbi:dihydrolipoyltranssuccinase [Wigglesworthia glossinidia endosymbiont of Glossina morsitans morsitans (Yale colony)]|uniref:Dihydrolipoyllysine-residue succinyltransferase n=1 Tax=Wigglesworthia glossinidia endosymbiont of Glossina morsitans morsitans (Yale colony) TaxID=1142511 RepID=H6Q5Y3_WIGGL|nr:2-oxoglutarate dehydrogenase complex dihydrolipoyllysine-residue succinyltransferase [Wigglesworthia glossinidia]AFA41179.1 dihydrolipoyltranssuccinase [Wigglesworthia glossinidia endosymbiont of Glossina morsitans morsitans (Yale colony)]
MKIIDILVPDLPESVTDATVSNWKKKLGDFVETGEILVELETDKVVLEVPSPNSGRLVQIYHKNSELVSSRQKLASIDITKKNQVLIQEKNTLEEKKHVSKEKKLCENLSEKKSDIFFSPSIRRLIAKQKNFSADIVQNYSISSNIKNYANQLELSRQLNLIKTENSVNNTHKLDAINICQEKRVKMTRLRKCISDRLLYVNNNTASLTTFNEVNMQSIINLREKYRDIFEQTHKIRLGYMSFFVSAVIKGLKDFPEINANIDGEDIVYHNYFNINIAVSTPKGLVTPVLKNADKMSIIEIEKKIKDFAIRGKNNKLNIHDLEGGSFTITNGGIFGSMLSTPIINPPQSAILGIHAIKDRATVIDKKVVITPMTYLALSYDHRLIDGKEAASFLVTVKNMLEDPIRIFLNI